MEITRVDCTSKYISVTDRLKMMLVDEKNGRLMMGKCPQVGEPSVCSQHLISFSHSYSGSSILRFVCIV